MLRRGTLAQLTREELQGPGVVGASDVNGSIRLLHAGPTGLAAQHKVVLAPVENSATP